MHRSRVKVTLNQEASKAIRRLSKASGESMSSVISNLFEPNVSDLNDMANLLEHAGQIREGMPETSRQFIRDVMSQMRNDMKPIMPEPESPRDKASRATPRERFQAETKRLEALMATEKAISEAKGSTAELEPWEIERELQEYRHLGGSDHD